MKIKLIPLLEYIAAFCIVMDCESIFRWMRGSGYIRLGVFLLFVISMGLLVRYGHVKGVKNSRKAIYVLTAFLAIFLFRNITNLFEACQFMLISLLTALYCRNGKNTFKLFEKVEKIVIVLAVISLFFFFFGSVSHILTPRQQLTVYVSDRPLSINSYFFLHYERQREVFLGWSFYRNTGIFYEGPKYALLLSLCLMYEVFINTETSLKKSLILSITLVSTGALTGIYGLVIIWVLYLYFRYPAKTWKGVTIRAVFLCMLVIGGQYLISYVSDMLILKGSTASFSTRMDNYIAGFKAWLDNPVFGAGYLNMDTIKHYYSSFRMNDIGYSNSVFRVLAQGGAFLFLLYLIPQVYAIIIAVRSKNMYLLSFEALFIYHFIATSFPYNYMTVLILCFFTFSSGVVHRGKKAGPPAETVK